MCTTFYMPFEKQRITGRTMDFEKKPDAAYIYFMPSGQEYVPPSARKVLADLGFHLYEPDQPNSYSFIGEANEFAIGDFKHTEMGIFADGLNEKGIAVSMQWLPGSEFPYLQDEAKEGAGLFLNWYTASYILGNVASLDEIPGLLLGDNPVLKVFEIDRIGLIDVSLPFHFNVQDAEGNSMIIEFEKKPGDERGKVRLYDSRDGTNPYLKASGGLTNYPFYDQQVSLYEDFLKANPGISPENKAKDSSQPQDVNGSGLLGMPGDGTPISRFTRTHLLMETVYTNPESDMDAVGAAIQMLGNIAVPIGTVTPCGKPEKVGDSTLWSAVRDHKNLKYYYSDQHNNQLRMIDLTELVNQTEIKSIPLELAGGSDWYSDITSKFKS